ncbi:MAG TPA: iron-containing redox enzyme family protein [Jatrophihabitans sp.]|jgi:hypothetical protein|uniref:iron-containing redox enzyme family protein n=1 Tax=Jatrophihabitans sp. TaxID=1932789 RepID=UPI002EEF6D76
MTLTDQPARIQPSTASASAADPSRMILAALSDPERDYAPGLADDVRAEISRVQQRGDKRGVDELCEQARQWASSQRARFAAMAEGVSEPELREVLIRRTALHCAPVMLTAGSWLQSLCASSSAERPSSLAMLAVYADDIGVGAPRAGRADAYYTLLQSLALADYAAPLSQLCRDARIPDLSFHLPSVLSAMSRRSADFEAELIGVDALVRSVGLLPPLQLLVKASPALADWARLDFGVPMRPADAGATPSSREALDLLAAEQRGDPAVSERAAAAQAWLLDLLSNWCDQVAQELQAAGDPSFEMAELMRLRAREGSVYHERFLLQDKPLSQWLRDCQVDPGPFLDALATSRLVKPGRAGASSLVNGLVSSRGPMFRVFSPADLGVIRRWINSLGSSQPDLAPTPTATPPPLRWLRTPNLNPPAPGPAPASIRQAYHLLLQPNSPGMQAWAARYVRGWLARAAHTELSEAERLPVAWSEQGLRPWLLQRHDQHSEDFTSHQQEELPSREALIDSTLQLAPLTLIDGSWLQGFTDFQHARTEVGYPLFDTYWDELGNGRLELNHPLIYRQVLLDMGIEAPPTASVEFAEWPLLRPPSFELPVYWLCIGRLPRTFMPEILGLNLAMELSGVGGTYRQAHRALREYGFNTRFVDIHNTIDNVATGHSAWAADAVDTYLASVGAEQGADHQEAAWRRVRMGYASLGAPDTFRAKLAQRRAERRGGPR